ncbi:MAG: hypothetical protein KAH12_10695, partial [Anaerolineales bacterium]|nr:hypothetical protein [Anaerolineales bacterium]
MMPSKFDRILEDCLSKMDRGESLMDILAVYPDLADKIKPLLMVAMLSRAVPQPVPGYTALRVGKNQLLAEMASVQAEGGFLERKPVEPSREGIVDRLARSLKQLRPAYRFAMLSLVVILAGGFFTFSASASGLADNIMQTLFFSFEQVGDLLLVKPSPPKPMGENPIFSSDYVLPDSPDYSGDFKGSLVVGGEIDNGSVDLSRLETRQHTFSGKPAEEADQNEVLDDEQVVVIDDKDLEKEEKEDEKDLEKDEKEDEKEADKAAKEDEKEADKA